jgi:hypothetical protein
MLIFAESLPDAFSDAILNHYMPGQEAYLRELAAILLTDNFGTNMNNVLMKDILGFSDASNNYNVNNWIQQRADGTDSNGNTIYNGSATQAQSQVNNEMNQAKNDLNKVSQAINDISAQEASLAQQVQQGKISPDAAAKLKGELEKDRAGLNAAKTNLTNLYNQLSQLSFAPGPPSPPAPSPTFTISGGNLSTISADEKIVINGDPNNNNIGGLTTIAGDIEGNAQYWGGQSQTAQMQLQMTMTQIQQEWAVVTTAMQLLNQMYMTIAQGINK